MKSAQDIRDFWFFDAVQPYWLARADDVEAVIRFVLRLAADLDLTGLWGFQYALTCSWPRLDAVGSGAHVIDLGARKSIG
ncbi:hypothetical protein [Silicibacter sp. TrichCH4B]|uniref:hypothetical protein n=1 Tax=Tritonibacter mobilis TaxID=379347 RepID=UPI0001B8A3BE|nr:conserved hypothetical protein [Ruegeria sp. TrichCH4B]